jgi:hypothetical protein
VSADLARARTYGAEPLVAARLERLTAAGHNQLYVDERRTFARFGEVLLRECPAAVWKARWAVVLALAALFGPAAAAYTVLRQDPSMAPQVLPEGMLERADAGRIRDSLGLTYYETDDGGLMATMLINNNVRVAFNCFAGGILLGVGSLIVLVYNGLSLGATAGHFANEGLGRYLFSSSWGTGSWNSSPSRCRGPRGSCSASRSSPPGTCRGGRRSCSRGASRSGWWGRWWCCWCWPD